MALVNDIKKVVDQIETIVPVNETITLGPKIKIKLWLLIVLIALGFGLLAVPLGSNHLPWLMVIAVLPLVLIFLHRLTLNLSWAPLPILFTAIYTPFYLSTGTESVIMDGLLVTILITGVYLVRLFIIEKRPEKSVFPQKALLAFMVVVPVSLVWSILLSDPLVVRWGTFTLVQIATTVVMVMLPAAFLLVSYRVNDLKVIKVMAFMMILGSILGYFYEQGSSFWEINTQGLFTMWVVTIAMGIAFFDQRLSVVLRGLLLGLAFVLIYDRFGVRITWLAGWLPAMVTIGVLTFMRSKKAFAIFLVAIAVLIVINFAYLHAAFDAERAESGYTRLNAWRVNWGITSQHLLFGTGPGGYAAYYMSYFPRSAMATHNNYVDILAETGIVGMMTYLLFIFPLAWMGYKLCIRLRARGDFTTAMANVAFAGTVGCIVAMAFGDWLLPFPYTQGIAAFDHSLYSWLFMGVIIALDRITKDDRDLKTTPALSQ